MHVTEQGKVDELASFLFKSEGLRLPRSHCPKIHGACRVKDGAAIAWRFRIALGIKAA